MNLGPVTTRLAAPSRQSRALVGTAALLLMALGAAACGSADPDSAPTPAPTGSAVPATGGAVPAAADTSAAGDAGSGAAPVG
ncbi:hypothetical protein LADH09A_005166, partial [Micromonospora sp. LAH09]|nr:hypothetical protein [Micromonospora cabrerizensis]